MKKTLTAIVISILFIFCIAEVVVANEIDDKNVAELFSVAKKIRSYGDDCWEILFEGDWQLPERSSSEGEADFHFYAMNLSVLKRPVTGDFNYPQFMKQFIQRTNSSFSKGEKALIVCLPKDIKFSDYKEYMFKPWPTQTWRPGISTDWTFVKVGPNWLMKSNWHINRTWYDGVRSIQDFACTGAGDKNIIKVEDNTITFIPRTSISFMQEHHKDNPYVGLWIDENGEQMLGKTLTPGKKVTLTINQVPRPVGWD